MPGESDIHSAIEDYKQEKIVEHAEPNYVYHLCKDPNDPYYLDGDQWALNKIDASGAWDDTTGDSDIIIAI